MQLSTGSLYKLCKDISFTKPIFLQLLGEYDELRSSLHEDQADHLDCFLSKA